MPEALPKNHSPSDEAGLWFQNRGLFSDHFLQARLPEWKEWKVDPELVPFQKSLQSLYDSKKSILPYLNEAQTELEFVQPVLDLLGYANSYIVQAPTKIGQHTNRPDYALFPDETTKNKAYQKLKDNNYTQCIGIADAKYWERELDLAKSSERDTFTNQNPSFQIAGYLTGTKQNWGILTNGRLWRLYSTKSHLPLGNYYQVDIVKLLEEAPVEIFKYFYVLFRKQALLQVEGRSLLDRILEGSEEYAVELEADIKERAYDVVELLCRGFAAAFTYQQLTDATLKSIYDNSLTLLYRLLFVFYAEARELLPLNTNASYRENYSLRKLTHDIDEIFKKEYELSNSSTQYYHYISNLFHLINNGDPKLGVPEYNGGLFELIEHPFLEKQAIPDAYLVRAIQQLARITDKKLRREVAVDYNTLSERHLGSIYEGLLEFKPMIAPRNLVVIKDKGSVKYAPADKHPGKKIAYTKDELYLVNDKGERKASGSYYTPEYIVNYIVENTLDPLLEEAHDKVKALKPEVDKAIAEWQKLKEQKQGLEPTEKYESKIAEESERLLEPYLSLKVLDPAMGSGHFLARATDFLAEAIATDPDIKSPLELTEESELTYYRRRVVESCIYGVDLNSLAVELAKLTLWLTTMAKSKPLSFLNHHLRVGNSLIGAKVADLDEIPKVKSRKKAIDLSRAPVQLGLFQQAFNQKLYDLLQNRALIAQLPTETLEDVHNKQKWEKDFEHNIQRFRTLADVWISTFFDNKVVWDEYNSLVENLQSPDSGWDKRIQKKNIQTALALSEEKRFFHWELEFPEVFYDEKGNRLESLGFDVVMGNPPYGASFDNFEKMWFREYFIAGRGLTDSYALFLEHSLGIIREGGYYSMIIPNSLLTLEQFEHLRQCILTNCRVRHIVNLVETVFEEVTISVMIPVLLKDSGWQAKKDSAIKVYHLVDPRRRVLRSTNLRLLILEQALILKAPPYEIPISAPPLLWALKDRFGKICSPLSGILEGKQGVKTGSKEKFLFKTEDIAIVPETKRGFIKQAVSGANLERYAFISDELLLYDVVEMLKLSSASPRHSYESLFNRPKLLVQHIRNQILPRRLILAYDDGNHYPLESVYILVPRQQTNLFYLLGLLNSKMMDWYYGCQHTSIFITATTLNHLPIRVIDFTTQKKERKQLFEKHREFYQEYLVNHNWGKLLTSVDEYLPQKTDGTPDTAHEKSDVVQDLLAFLAEEMTRLNKEKRSRIKSFLTWLEKEVLKGSVEGQKNKTKIKGFHEGTLEDLLDVLKRNKAIPAPCPSSTRDTIAGEFSAAMNVLTPLQAHIEATDKLIDQIVYRLYGLTDDEIAIVEGQKS